MDQRTRKLITLIETLRPRDNIDRLYGIRKEGGWRLTTTGDCMDAVTRIFEEYKHSPIPSHDVTKGQILSGV